MYLATGIAGEGNEPGYPPGEKHSMLIFLAGYTDNYDWKEAEKIANQNYWGNIEFTKAGKITTQQVSDQDRSIRECFATALKDGNSMIVYSAVEGQ